MRADVENARAVIATAQANVARDAATAQRAAGARPPDRPAAAGAHLEERARPGPDGLRHRPGPARGDPGPGARRPGGAPVVAGPAGGRRVPGARGQGPDRVGPGDLPGRRGPAARRPSATVRQKQAALEQARLDLEHTEIRAPVDGVVVSRAVDVGQTVAASLQAPTLFTIAAGPDQDAGRGGVDEADVGRIREGMAAVVHGRRLPGPDVPRRDLPDPQGRPGRPERRHLHDGRRRRQPRADACCPA